MANIEHLLREYGGENAVVLSEWLDTLVNDAAYSRGPALKIEAIARNPETDWPLRRLAALMLESALLRIRGDKPERRFWIQRFGMTDSAELHREGFNTREPIELQLWRRMNRFGRIDRLLRVQTDAALRDYFRASEHECRLTLSRYLFSITDVIARIEQHVRRSEGIPDHDEHGEFHGERRHATETLPAMERAIVQHLVRDSVIRWASPATRGVIDSLAAQPIGTVVVTIRPPGSTHEIQIKRAGRPRDLPFDVVWRRNGDIVPLTHHLDGGCELNSAAYEAQSSSFFSRVFREVHGFDAAMSRPISIARVDTIPTSNGDADLMEYFNTPRVFGNRFYEMRWHLYHSLRMLADHAGERLHPGDDDELTRDFIRRTKPAQSILVGTTALRLDRLWTYLSPKGAEEYFQRGLGIIHDVDDDRRFADNLLDEILGIYEPPRIAWRSYGRYVDSAFRVPENRARADRVYASLLEQTGRFWGTLLAIRGYSRGESFVERNVGLRSVWSGGEWQVRIVFMDHDSLIFGSLDVEALRPQTMLSTTMTDADHILGGVYPAVRRERGEIGCLREIYRIGRLADRRGMDALQAAMKHAYDRTQDAVQNNEVLTRLFPPHIVPRLRDWDDVVRQYLAAKTPAARERWSRAAQAKLILLGYDAETAAEYVQVIEREEAFLRRLAFLFEPRTSSITRAPAGRSTPPIAVRAGHGVMPRPGSQFA